MPEDNGYIGNVIRADGDEDVTVFADILDHAKGGKPFGGGMTVFDPYLKVSDDEDDDAALFFMYGDADGGTFYAPDCPSPEEYERRVIRALGMDGITIDDCGPAVRREG